MRWHVIYSKRTLWLSNLLSKNTANTPNASSRRVSPRCVCVWQILNGLCLVLLLRKWTWHYSSITTAIPPLISPLFSSLPPLSLRLSPSPRSPQFFSSLRLPFFLSGLFKSSFVFFLLSVRSQFFAGYASFSLCVFLLFIMILPNSPCVQYIPYFLISLYCFFLPASIALLFCQSSNLLLSIITLCTILLLYLSFKQPCSSAQLFILGLFKCTETSDNMNALAVFFFFFCPWILIAASAFSILSDLSLSDQFHVKTKV